MNKDQDPFYWERLKQLYGENLKAALHDCAARDLPWAIDQARILYGHTEARSAQATAVVDFCAAYAERATTCAASAGLQAWVIASADEGENQDIAAQSVRKILDEQASINLRGAWDMAVLTLANTEKYNPVHTEAVSFLAEQDEDTEGTLAASLSREFADMAEADLARIVERMKKVALTQPYRAVHILREVVESQGCKRSAAAQDALATIEALKDTTLFMAQMLEKEHGIPVLGVISESSQSPVPDYPAAKGSLICDRHGEHMTLQ